MGSIPIGGSSSFLVRAIAAHPSWRVMLLTEARDWRMVQCAFAATLVATLAHFIDNSINVHVYPEHLRCERRERPVKVVRKTFGCERSVEASYRRRGYARFLVAGILAELRDHAADIIIVAETGSGAQRVYGAAGFASFVLVRSLTIERGSA